LRNPLRRPRSRFRQPSRYRGECPRRVRHQRKYRLFKRKRMPSTAGS
jgi:hypothetical protein